MSIEIPQTIKNASLPAKPITPATGAAVTVVEISDPTVIGQAIEVIEQDVVQLESKPLRVRRVVVRLGTALVLFHSTNRAVRTRTRLHVDFVAFSPVSKSPCSKRRFRFPPRR